MADCDENSGTEIEIFLRSIPEVNSFLSSEDGRKPQRDEIFRSIQKKIAQHVSATKLKEDDWISQLAELDLDDTSTDDETSSIARLLTRYVLNRPWVFHPWLVQQTFENRDDNSDYGAEMTTSEFPMPNSRHRSVAASDDLANLVTHNVAKLHDLTLNVKTGNFLESFGNKSKILARSDAMLGLAGFSPLIDKCALQDEAAWSEAQSATTIEYDFVDQYHKHIRFSGTKGRQCAAISFFQHDKSNRGDSEDTMIRAKSLVDHGMINLMSHLNTLPDDVAPFTQLLFIRQVSSTAENGTDRDSHYTEIASIQVKEINDFFDAYAKSRHIFDQRLEASENEDHSLFTRLWTVAASQILGVVYPILLVFTAGSVLFSFVSSFLYRQSDLALLQKLSPLMKSLEPLLEALGIDRFDHDKISESAQFEVLHLTSLVVQALTLILQSYLRGSETPFCFEFLTTPISDFILEGSHPSPDALKLYAGSQKLSCLGDMLQKEVLAFGSQKSLFQNRLDVIATPEQVAAMWGPAEFIFKDPSTKEAEQTTQKDLAIFEETDIFGIRIQNGFILPSDESVDGIPKWHWESLNQNDENDISHISRGNASIDRHIRVRIGGTNSLRLTPIGPSYLNKSCPRSAGLCSEKRLGSSFQVLGVSDPQWKMEDFNLGLQAGQIVNVVTEATFIRVPGRTVKEAVLNSVGFFEFQIAEFDQMWGLFVSLCTGVMTRVRLREIVAFICLHVPRQVPVMPGKTREASLHAFLQVLSGEESLTTWVESLAQEFEQNIPGTGDYLRILQEQVLSLFKNVMAMLKETGVSRNGDLHLAFITQRLEIQMLALSAEDHPWTKVLSDSSLTATFACVSPYCFQTMGHMCQKDQWRMPDKCRLATKLNAYTHHLQWAADPTDVLKVGKSYCINARHLNMLAKVDGFVTSFGEHPFYSISTKKSLVPLSISQHIRKRADLREENSETAVKCIISGYAD
ncbi:uncharacterized protein N7503_003320 [Penicillium pulvis]|uniref:uncharacterized protein n=1 Tax=Penicillium pulvis TaxID=1562058 RepID=UPI002548881D|nr:uncharacterized protein N7503_003320 [Penicillium pulvis]KAJ5805718.1 hypothetical protein N7503_003320 [Penicillium pulvis]